MSDEKDIADKAIDALKEAQATTPMPTYEEVRDFVKGKANSQVKDKVELRLAIDSELRREVQEMQSPDPHLTQVARKSIQQYIDNETQGQNQPSAQSAFGQQQPQQERSTFQQPRPSFVARYGRYIGALAAILMVAVFYTRSESIKHNYQPLAFEYGSVQSGGVRGSAGDGREYVFRYRAKKGLRQVILIQFTQKDIELLHHVLLPENKVPETQPLGTKLPLPDYAFKDTSAETWSLALIYTEPSISPEAVVLALKKTATPSTFVNGERKQRQTHIEQLLSDFDAPMVIELSDVVEASNQ